MDLRHFVFPLSSDAMQPPYLIPLSDDQQRALQPPYLIPLSDDQQRALGLPPQTLAIADRVRYGEIDTLNHANNKAYMGWFETLRVEHFRRFCEPHFSIAPRTVLRSADVRFLRELVADETYVATARVVALRNTSYTMQQQIWSGGLRATMQAVMVMLHPDGTRLPLPDPLRHHFITVEGATPEA